MTHNTYVNGKVHVRRTQCATCIFRPGNLMHLAEGRVEQMVKDSGDDGCIPCHSHLSARINPVCRGFFDQGNRILRMAEAMDVIEWVSHPLGEVDDQQDHQDEDE